MLRTERAFDDFDDFRRRARLAKDELAALADAGAFETLVRGRRQALFRARAPRVSGLFSEARFDEPESRSRRFVPRKRSCSITVRKGFSWTITRCGTSGRR